MAVNRDRFLSMVASGELKDGDEVIVTERKTYTVVSAGTGRIRLDREINGGSESLMMNPQMPSKLLEDAEFEVDSADEPTRLREHVQAHLTR